MSDHDWHLFDEEHGYEVARSGDLWLVRHRDMPDTVTELTHEQFDAWRTAGMPNPAGLH